VPRLHLLRVFCGQDGRGGNPLAVFLDGSAVAHERRQAVAADLGLSETVFVDDRARGELRIFTPAVELPFAGHPTVGTSWLLAHEGDPVAVLRPPAGEVPVRAEDERWLVAARPEWSPPFRLERLDSPAAVDALTGPPDGHDLIVAWAWSDEAAGVLRARVFLSRIGIAEDEATGSAAVLLASALSRPLDIHQGRGSRILARPAADGRVEIGGLTALDAVRDYSAPGG
jgi:predicted PhzF superfamily epimerase YddE/YHI9